MIADVRKNITAPLIVGGGIRSAERAYETCRAGADIIVVGNSVEEEPELIGEIAAAVREGSESLKFKV
jgi:putative glycerol-1-phosphate prenyltransferase